MPAYSSTNQSSRVFAPYAVVTQDSSRIAVNITTTDGLPSSGITAGDVLRYDPTISGYTLSCADTNENSEVVGVVESVSGQSCLVVISGSIRYPSARLSAITTGGDGGIDVLFLSNTVRGGLTGTVDVTSGDKIVKPVIQIAPHGVYNGVVINYLGYRAGNQTSSSDEGALLGPGAIMLGPIDSAPGSNWLRIDNPVTLLTADYGELYSLYSSSSTRIEKLIVSTGTVSSLLIGKTAYQTIDGSNTNSGTIVAVDVGNATIDVQKNAGVGLMIPSQNVRVDANNYSISSSSFYKFILPKVTVTDPPSQSGSSFVPYIKAYSTVNVTIPDALTISSLTVSPGPVSVGSYTNLQTTLNDIYSKLNTLNSGNRF